MSALRWRVQQKAGHAVMVVADVSGATDREVCFLIRSDVHFDNAHSRSDLEMKHLEEAKERNAGILDLGDLFDAMQSVDDKRQSKSELRDEHKRIDYFNSLIETAYERYKPYARNFILLARGNHETKMTQRHGVDLTAWLAERLRAEGSSCAVGGYTGWVKFSVRNSTEQISAVVWYTHGSGGGAEVTRNVIQLAGRTPVYIESADIHVCGHSHHQWYMVFPRLRLNERGKIERRDTHFLHTPTYKDEYRHGEGGWSVERGQAPRPLGAWWVYFRFRKKNTIEIDIRRAT